MLGRNCIGGEIQIKKMKFWIHLVLLFIVFYVCTGCNTVDIEEKSVSVLTETLGNYTNSVSDGPVSTPVPSLTLSLNPLSSETPTPKPTIKPVSKTMTDRCIEISENPLSFSQLEGGLVVNGYGGGKTGNLASILNFETGELKNLVSNELDGSVAIAVSPDNELVLVVKRPANEAYMRKIALLDGNAQLVKEIPLEAEWGFNGWLDNEQIVAYKDWPDNPFEGWPYLTIILNPFSNIQKEFPPDYPNFNTVDVWYPTSMTIFDPTLTRVIYPARKDHEDDATAFVLWDLQNEQTITSIPAILSYSPQPVWSLDGEFVIIGGLTEPGSNRDDHEIYKANRDGMVQILTHFSDDPPVERFRDFALSPNSQLVAFWISDTRNKAGELAVLNTSTGEIINYCVAGDLTEQRTSGTPIWSPDGRYLVVEQIVNKNQSQIIIVDTMMEKGYMILKNQIPVGWMTVGNKK